MATSTELIAANMTVEEIRDHIGADSLAFLTVEGLMKALKAEAGYCNALFYRRLSLCHPNPTL